MLELWATCSLYEFLFRDGKQATSPSVARREGFLKSNQCGEASGRGPRTLGPEANGGSALGLLRGASMA
ncbi:hypothetical protein CEXT_297781 [Caerostris extrusa]|uniref:Uncharacterized protein n=1 Tax=Caerostris extrusa TaxID=172846 RepID=A0AAV4WZR9_CAEEX|nr:hypothetical protein CEXT_297781 [Caerostris extrusa]